jgi:hypothetical protein
MFIAHVTSLEHNLFGYWGPFETMRILDDFMTSKRMPEDSYRVIILNKPDLKNKERITKALLKKMEQ